MTRPSARSARTSPVSTPAATPAPTTMVTAGRTCAITGKSLAGEPRIYLRGVNRQWPALWSAFQAARKSLFGIEPFFESDDSLISRGTIDLSAMMLDADIKTVIEPFLRRLHDSVREDVRDHLRTLATKTRQLAGEVAGSTQGKKRAPEIAEL